MAFEVDFYVENIARVISSLDFLNDLWKIRTREVFDDWGKDLITIAEQVSPQDKLRQTDSRRRPKSESFAEQWEFEVGYAAEGPVLNVGNTDERAHLVLEPTSGKETVTPRGDFPLKFYYPSLGPFFAWSVHKEPTPGQPAHLWTIEEFDIDQRLSELGNRLVR